MLKSDHLTVNLGIPVLSIALKGWVVILAMVSPYCLGLGEQRGPDAELHAQRAQAAIASNQPNIASVELEALIRLEPNDVNARASLGMVLFTQGHFDRAAINFKAALARSPSLWNAKAFLGMCEIRLGRADQGRSDIESALPKLTDKLLRRQAGLDLINSYADEGREDRAAQIIESLRYDEPDSPDFLFAAYQVHSALASAALQKLSQVAPDSARVHQVLGDDMLIQENYPGAINEYRAALKIDPRLTGAHLSIGRALLAQGGMAQNTSTAENEFQAELAVDRGNANALFELGQIAYRRGNEETAEAFFSKSVERRPSFSDAHIALAKISSDHNRDAEAIEHLQTALKSAPNNQTAHYRLAQLYRKSGDSAKAAQQFEIARRLAELNNYKTPTTRRQEY
jgi:tetratricopeptide (TPR) repeat protein